MSETTPPPNLPTSCFCLVKNLGPDISKSDFSYYSLSSAVKTPFPFSSASSSFGSWSKGTNIFILKMMSITQLLITHGPGAWRDITESALIWLAAIWSGVAHFELRNEAAPKEKSQHYRMTHRLYLSHSLAYSATITPGYINYKQHLQIKTHRKTEKDKNDMKVVGAH